MQDYHIKKEYLQSGQRKAIVRETFAAKLATLYQPHAHLRGNEQGVAMYLSEIIDQLDEKLPRVNDREIFIDLLRKVWKSCVNKHDSRYFFSLSLINKTATDITRDYNRKYVDPLKPVKQFGEEKEKPRGSKDDPASQGWTIEKCEKAIADMRDLIANGDINRAVGMALVGIPQHALRRLKEKQGDVVPDFDVM